MNCAFAWAFGFIGSVLLFGGINPLPVDEDAGHLRPSHKYENSFRGENSFQIISNEGWENLRQFFSAIEDSILDERSRLSDPAFKDYAVAPRMFGTSDTGIPGLTCPICKIMLGILEADLRNGKPVEEIEAKTVNLCITMKVAAEMVCRGTIGAFTQQVYTVVKMSGIKGVDICGFLVGAKCEPKGWESRFNWTVAPHPNPKPSAEPLKPPQNPPHTRRVLHLSDTHLDPYYKEGSNAICGLPLCCRSSVGGEPANASLAAGKWGDHRGCDSPLRTIDSMMTHIAKTEKIDYIIWTGDLPPHDVYNQSVESNFNVNHYVYELFMTYFPDTPIFPALGNHESHPINSFPQPDITDKEHSIAWLYEEISKSWPKLMLQDSAFYTDTLLKGGYYSILVEPGFRIISLNMNYGNNLNFWLLRDSNDPAGELAWLTEELGKAEAKGEKVHLLGHIPPGNQDCLRIWGRNFRKIINRFENTVTAQFYGHSHYDELIVFHDDDLKRATNVAYIGPSTTTFTNLNPAYKIYTVDGHYSGSTRMVLDGEGYYMNITDANLYDKPEWKKLFSYKESYGMESLSPEDWSKFVRKLPADDALFQKFFKHFHRESETFSKCDEACKQQVICKLMTAVAFDHSICQDMGIEASTRFFKKPGVISYDNRS